MNGTTFHVEEGMLPLSSLQPLTYAELGQSLEALLAEGGRLVAFFADLREQNALPLFIYAVVMDAGRNDLTVLHARTGRTLQSLTPDIPQLHLFERETAEQFGVVFAGHPWSKPVRFHAPRPGSEDGPGEGRVRPVVGVMDYYQIRGDEIHEVGVGPVHAGVIEPGHFRFQCHGESVLHLEISLGYQHRGIEWLLAGGPWPQTPYQVETAAGDTSIAHMSAYSKVLEALSGSRISGRAIGIRAIALELERLANHVGDIGALAGDVGFLPTASYCGRLRGEYLNMTAAVCGSRFGRGLVRPGGVLFDIDAEAVESLQNKLAEVEDHTRGALDLFFDAPSVLSRLEGVGKVCLQDALQLGLVGIAGKACGIDCDSRGPEEQYGFPGTGDNLDGLEGDVYARAWVRRMEIEQSTEFIRRRLRSLPAGILRGRTGALAPDCLGVGIVEGWRGPVTHVALTDSGGRFRRYKIIDPSFFNWSGLAMALRNEQISDFPLCNKSFNLSYCGFDL